MSKRVCQQRTCNATYCSDPACGVFSRPVLEELRLLWEEKLVQSGVLEVPSANELDTELNM